VLRFGHPERIPCSHLSLDLRQLVRGEVGEQVEVVEVFDAFGLRFRGYFLEGGSATILDPAGHVVARMEGRSVTEGNPLVVDALREAWEATILIRPIITRSADE